jgi:hypothetical protein
MTVFDAIEKFNRSDFPDLEKAAGAVALDSLITPGKQPAKIAQQAQERLDKQLGADFCSFQLSLGSATSNGIENTCVDKHQHEKVDSQLGNWQAALAPNKRSRHPSKAYKAGNKLPRPVASAPGGATAQSQAATKINQGATSAPPKTWYVPTIKPSADKGKQERTADKFVRAQAGQRKTAVGDAAIVFGSNGTPYPGDSYLDRSNLQNQSANLASSTPPVLEPPSAIKPKVVSNGQMKRASNGQIAPQSNTVGNAVALVAIAAVVSAIMFALQYVVALVSFVFNIQNLLMTCNNIAASFTALFGTIGSLLGLGDDVGKPLTETVDGILNSVFGKEKVSFIKYQWAKVATTLSAASNVLSGLRGVSSTLGNAIEVGANSSGRIGNGLKAAGFLDSTMAAFDEKVSTRQASSKLVQVGEALNVTDGASASLSQAAADIKSGNKELEEIDKQFEEQKAATQKNAGEADKQYGAGAVPEVPNFRPGDV